MHVRRVSLTNHIRNFTKRQNESVSHAGIGTPRKHAGKPVVLANRLIVELAMEAPERREWPRTEAEMSPKSLRNCRMIQRKRSRIDSAREAPPTILRASTSPIRLFPPGKATGSGAADRWREICESLARRRSLCRFRCVSSRGQRVQRKITPPGQHLVTRCRRYSEAPPVSSSCSPRAVRINVSNSSPRPASRISSRILVASM